LSLSIKLEEGVGFADRCSITHEVIMPPIATSDEQSIIAARFNTLAAEWKKDTAFLSSSSAMVSHPAYKAIIDLGWPAVPLMLRDMEQEPVHWFEALRAITGENPVERENWGNTPAMASAWLNWGRKHDLV
jgi:hypothetical protein